RTQVDDVNLHFKGQIARPEFADRVQLLKEQWPLQQGMPFINESWHNAKAGLLDDVSRKDFYFARLVNTQATVDAEASKADLFVDLASGPRVRLGKLSTTGLERVPQKRIERYVQYTPGEPYDQ